MKRRTFLKSSAPAGASTLVAAPAIAQGSPEIKWRQIAEDYCDNHLRRRTRKG